MHGRAVVAIITSERADRAAVAGGVKTSAKSIATTLATTILAREDPVKTVTAIRCTKSPKSYGTYPDERTDSLHVVAAGSGSTLGA
jgi:hypothetical protein